MNIMREQDRVKPKKWARYQFNLTTHLGEDGTRLTGCQTHIDLSRKVAAEGMVLLENNGFLPLRENTRVALFGIGSLNYVMCGGGSGRVYSQYVRNLYEGFCCKAPRYTVYTPLTKFYYDYAVAHIGELNGDQILEEIVVPQTLVEEAAKNTDVAIITIHRFSGEDWDRSSERGDFYLTDEEEAMIMQVTSTFAHSVVVLNVGGMIDVSWAKSNPKIDAVLLAWQAGMEGGLAIADILCGDVNPSGKLTDTFAKEFADYPSADTFHESRDFVCYYEDIYVGYRYFETIPGAKERVNYPFGYGLSYTEFSIGKPVAEQRGEEIQVTVSVKNAGHLPGKEVVQVYLQAPQGVLGKSNVSLMGFQKTKLLQPGESQTLTIQFPIADMASYDDLGKLQMSAYLLEQGEYVFLVGNNCRDLQAADWRYEVKEKFRVVRQLQQRCAPNKLPRRLLSDGSFEALPSFPVKKHDDVPPYVNPESAPERVRSLQAVARGEVALDAFIAQMTTEELIAMVSGIPSQGLANTSGMGNLKRLGVPPIMTVDGPAGIRLRPYAGIATTAWPCATLIASTWDPELAYEIGAAGAKEAKENGLAIWLTPGLNIHRNPLCGRNFEYFSEDPLLSGKFAAAKVKGIQSQKIAASAKHFACNNKETNRKYSDSRVSERALREIYLRGFEICVKEAQPWTVMSSYNIINGRRCCESYEQLQGILREEWGYQNMVTSDWETPCDQTYCVLSGNDLRMPYGEPKVLWESLNNGRLQRGHLELCVKRILETILKFE